MKHPNIHILEQIYQKFSERDIQGLLALCADEITFQVAGKSQLAGKFTKKTFASEFLTRLQEISQGSYSLEVHDIMASDRHGMVLVSSSLMKNGEKVLLRAAHIWRIENGKPVAWYEYPRDLYQFDAIWS